MRLVWLCCLVLTFMWTHTLDAKVPSRNKRTAQQGRQTKQKHARKNSARTKRRYKRHRHLRWRDLRKVAVGKKGAGNTKTSKRTTPPPTRRSTTDLSKVELTPQLPPEEKVIKRKPLPPRFGANQKVVTLAEVFKMAKKVNLDLRILKERLVQAELIKAKTWAMLKPNLNLSGSYTRNQQAVSFNPAASIIGLANALPEPIKSQILAGTKDAQETELTPLNQLGLQLQMRWAFLNFRAIPLLRIAYMSVDQVKESAKQLRREVMFGIARAYYGVLLTDGLVDISRETLSNAREHLTLAEARYQAGTANSLVVTRAKLEVIKAQRSLIQARNGLRNAKLAVALLLNKPTFSFRPQRPSRPILPSGSPKAWVRKAERHLPELKAAKMAVNIADNRISEVWLQFLPTVALVGSLQATNATGFAGQNTTWSVSLQGQIALYDGGTRFALLQENFSKRRQAKLEYLQARRKAQNNILASYLSLNDAKATLKVAKQQLVLAKRSYKLTQERFKTGVATPVEVTDAQIAYNSAQVSLLRETLNLEVAVLTLQRAMGTFRY